MKNLFIIFTVFIFSFPNIVYSQTIENNTQVFSSPAKTALSSSQAGAKALNVISTSGIGIATNLSLTWISVGLAAALASVWDGDSGGVLSSSSTTN